ncbi:MAG: class I mannose-6-phosphate isomerase [Planctomycetaceae bacterium]|jgi:mannose-6-phosphate isomerase|nr:class I mannose-6-phosphate isomerase [Planctomycetaceae bacterium]
MIIDDVILYPLRFEPIYKNYVWGGTRFGVLFGRVIPVGWSSAAESWETADFQDNISIIKNGELRGYSLRDVLLARSNDLLGSDYANCHITNFPLLLKYLDASSTLSIQVHPDDELARSMSFDYVGKSEAWVVVEAEPGSVVWIGTEGDYSNDDLRMLITRGGIESVMKRIEVHKGDCFYIPPGTLHALGCGVVVAEIQQPSDVTFRVFDWNRVDWNGQPRKLHKEEAIHAIKTDKIINPIIPKQTNIPNREQLVRDPHFLLNRWTFDKPTTINLNQQFSLWTVLNGTVKIGQEILNRGDTILTPASLQEIEWIPIDDSKITLAECKVPINHKK